MEKTPHICNFFKKLLFNGLALSVLPDDDVAAIVEVELTPAYSNYFNLI